MTKILNNPSSSFSGPIVAVDMLARQQLFKILNKVKNIETAINRDRSTSTLRSIEN